MREVVGENHLRKWLAVRDEYCVDFEALKAKIKKERLKENLRKFRENFLEMYEILTQKMKVSA